MKRALRSPSFRNDRKDREVGQSSFFRDEILRVSRDIKTGKKAAQDPGDGLCCAHQSSTAFLHCTTQRFIPLSAGLALSAALVVT